MAVRKSPDELLWDQLTGLDVTILSFGDCLKWSRSIMRYIKKKDVQRYQIEHCIGLLDEIIYEMQRAIESSDVCDDGEGSPEITESGKASYFDILLGYSEIKEKYDRKEELKKQKDKLSSRLQDLEKRLNGD